MTAAKIGPAIALEWYDGPIVEIARVDFGDREPLVEVSTVPCRPTGGPPHQNVTARLSRENLVAMLDLLDGKPVEDHQGDIHQFVAAGVMRTTARGRAFCACGHARETHPLDDACAECNCRAFSRKGTA